MTEEMLLTAYTAAGGTLTGEALAAGSREAWRRLLLETRGAVTKTESDTPEGALIVQCFHDLVEFCARYKEGVPVAESLGQWSRQYRQERSREDMIRSILRSYLGETGLLYRGWPR